MEKTTPAQNHNQIHCLRSAFWSILWGFVGVMTMADERTTQEYYIICTLPAIRVVETVGCLARKIMRYAKQKEVLFRATN